GRPHPLPALLIITQRPDDAAAKVGEEVVARHFGELVTAIDLAANHRAAILPVRILKNRRTEAPTLAAFRLVTGTTLQDGPAEVNPRRATDRVKINLLQPILRHIRD